MDRATTEALFAPLDLEQALHLLDSLTWFPESEENRWPRVADYVARNVTTVPRPDPGDCRSVADRAMALAGSPAGHGNPSERTGRWRDVPDAKALYQVKYDLMSLLYPDDWFTYMNMGYQATENEAVAPAADEPIQTSIWRYAQQLYDLVAAQAPLEGKDLLEVGSGRGGGAAFVTTTHSPRSVVGLDYSPNNVEFCSRVHRIPGLDFRHGDAEDLPFADHTFDAVLNIESAHCYPDVDRFFSEVRRVLKPGGHLLFADEWWTIRKNELAEKVSAAGLRVVAEEDITDGVIRALDELPNYVEKLLVDLEDGAQKRAYARFFNERVCRESAHSYRSGRFVFLRQLAVRDA
ncbi:Methyltransferase domain-containing protein [Amycolatopsis pretoriensis]|uniref:Methyltransferase domain-containing protein n=1 Tax=Amycolatopsis pretoriensis TaxID=218821 RepID=A0A1H5QCA3_9PSEU|nr:class I SAM-dependent methyltransferase [Amycolatopsis pretoriensis]SEF23474.1 Methyltransferase domain-containing protein [Amycolatopsis pretoriensis]